MLHFSKYGGKVLSNTLYRSITSHTILNNRSNIVTNMQCRGITTKDIFNSESLQNFKIPEAPQPPLPDSSIAELLEKGESILKNLDLFDWYKPTGYLRYGMEYIHMNFDMPWWGTIVTSTIVLRLLLVYVPILSQRYAARRSHYRTELKEFADQMNEAKMENDNRKMQIILLKQQKFFNEKNISPLTQLGISFSNGAIFLSQYFAIKEFTNVDYPGFDVGGTLWFNNLSLPDPYYILPLITSLTIHYTMKKGTETGTDVDQLTPFLSFALLYGLPFGVGIWSITCPSAIVLYWATSNTITLIYSILFRIEPIRKLLKIPKMIPPESKKTNPIQSISESYKNFRNLNSKEPSLKDIREKDFLIFKKAGKSINGKK
ncbi:Mitochondrial inner membrane protein OXA1L [Strongyloides ratti]|uniref:Mitochondrial inner membrane protein OXA1L n=1 Tax=Strongyloides ratti TaxID=34506 RepID=A0A090L8S2_STRRB|nr:Mitochondrial inner membrane protein OXA1L [Strongyloides ratti]CEF66161.1 Mitochondrial inner membrane protein OXA1L [Strongyloides ratti]